MFKTVVFATDGSETADRALPYAKALAAGEGASLVVIHGKELLLGRSGGYPALADEEDLETKIEGQVDEARKEGIDATFRLVSGATPHAAHMVADVAREVGADVIVVGTRGHAPVAGLLLGSVTQRLLHIAPCPVLAVPAGKHAGESAEERESAAAASS
ncbi:MAG TPA: universal stress protein [Gaiellaceae bacterium]|jgi:nucleotide-binding universal stress UspA family protein